MDNNKILIDKNSIFVVTHKQVEIPNIDGYIPITVGSNKLQYNNSLADNIGDNISDKNSTFCELTALYWIWKNVYTNKYIGMCHYRRYFQSPLFNIGYKGILHPDKIDKYIGNNDIIIPYPETWFNATVEQWFLSSEGKKKDLVSLRNVIGELYPEYLNSYDHIMNGYSASYLNMFICKKNVIDDYCKWLFSILFELEKKVDLSGYSRQESRIFGFLSERLFNVWIDYNKCKVKFLQVYQTDNEQSDKEIVKRKLKYLVKRHRILKPFERKWGYLHI